MALRLKLKPSLCNMVQYLSMLQLIAFFRFLAFAFLFFCSLSQAIEPASKKVNSPQAVIRAFYQAVAANQPDKAAELFSFSLLSFDDEAQMAAFREELSATFADEFTLLSHNHPKAIELIDIEQLKSLPDELTKHPGPCHAFKINDNISQEHGGVEWSLCQEKEGWKMMFLLSTE